MARQMGCNVPPWQEDWLLDFHALDAEREPGLSLPVEEEME